VGHDFKFWVALGHQCCVLRSRIYHELWVADFA